MSVVKIENIGPIKSLSIPVTPGVTVLRGRNESGKSTAIRSLEAISGTKTKLETTDGEKVGSVTGAGVVLHVGQRTTRSGELEFRSIEERLDIGALVDPGIQDPKAANRKRIKALLSLSKSKLEVSDFCSCVPEGSDLLTEDDYADDPVEMAGRIKRRLEKLARDESAKATEANQQAKILKAKLDDLPECEADEDAASQRLRNAIETQASLRERKRQADECRERYEAAKAKLDQHGDVQSAVPDAESALAAARKDMQAAESLIASLEEQMRDAKMRRAEASMSIETAEERLQSARRQDDLLAKWRDAVEADQLAPPTAKEMQAADNEVAAATEMVAASRDARERKRIADELAEARERYKQHTVTEGVLRNGAKATDDVLSDAVKMPEFRVIKGELHYVEGDRCEPYSRLSDGKRWQVAIAVAASALHGEDGIGIIPLSQVAWEGLDSKNRKLVMEAAVKNNVAIVTAEKSDGDLEAVEVTAS